MNKSYLFYGISELVQPHTTMGISNTPLDITYDAALLINNGVVAAAGKVKLVKTHPLTINAEKIDLGNRAVIPGLVDSHTHVVFAGNRMKEMQLRSHGETYESIAQKGGGIVNSVSALADCTLDELVEQSQKRIETMINLGVTTLEIKSGYGLSPKLESKQLDAIEILAKKLPIDIYATVLAHVIPKEKRSNRQNYIDTFCNEILVDAAKRDIVHFCDIFVENGAFTVNEAKTITQKAKEKNLQIKLHVDQLSDGNGANLAAELKALSADHLELSNIEGLKALAQAKTIATMLPGCGLFLGGSNWPSGRSLRDAGCQIAIATDCNPGSSMVSNLPLCATIAATQCELTLEESLWGITRGGAKALGLDNRGCLTENQKADFVVLNSESWMSLMYYSGDIDIFKTYRFK